MFPDEWKVAAVGLRRVGSGPAGVSPNILEWHSTGWIQLVGVVARATAYAVIYATLVLYAPVACFSCTNLQSNCSIDVLTYREEVVCVVGKVYPQKL